MKRVKGRETMGNGRVYLTRSKKRQEEAAALDEKDLISRLPLDLKLQFLVKLPAKSIAKFNFVSKLWSSVVRGRDLTEFLLSRSLARPSFLFILDRDNLREFHLYSQEEPVSHNLSSITPETISCNLSAPIHGLICSESGNSKVIFNPSTGQIVTLPTIKTKRRRPDGTFHFLGYDPVNDVYKVLSMMRFASDKPGLSVSEEHQVFTLGAKKKAWRMIECNHPYLPVTNEICIDGVVYYAAWHNSHPKEYVIVSFDVRSEDFGVIKLPKGVQTGSSYTEFVNIHGNIALVWGSFPGGNVDLCVLQDVKKQEWSKISFLLPDIVKTWSDILRCRGTISTGEIIFAPSYSANPYFLVYYDLKRNNARRVDVEGVRDGDDDDPIEVFLDHVESHMFLQREV